MNSFSECQQKVEDRLNNLIINEQPKELYEPIEYILKIGGKRIRPSLVLMGCNVFTEKPEIAMDAALAIEVFHNFTLMHDDIMDKADLRRNKQTVHKKWNKNIAILSGDAMMILAYKFLSNYDPHLFSELFQIFNKTALEVCEGQQYDMNFESAQYIGLDDYLKMIELKTSVLIGASFKMGAIIGGADDYNLKSIYEYGKNLGIAFQLQDDLLDVFGETLKFGKKTGGDIIANKKTFLLIQALENAEGETKVELLDWLDKKNFDPDAKVEAIKKIYNKLDIKEKTLAKIDEFFNISKRSLENISVKNERKSELKGFAEYLMKRDK